MRDTIAWSHDLLSAEEQTLFRRLAVFAGGFTLDAAEHVIAAATVQGELLDGVTSLIDSSLLRPAPVPHDSADPVASRFAMLETIREFGL